MNVRSPRRVRSRRGEGDRLREEILNATEKLLIATKDIDAVSIRAVAKAVGVTPPSIYLHFAHKEELILEVCERQFAAFDAYIRGAAGECDDAVECVKAMGRSYIRYGLEHPEEYRFLFMSVTPEWAAVRVRERIQGLSGFGSLVTAVQRCIDDGAFASGDAFSVACGLWTGVHGITSLLISKPFFPWPEQEAFIEGCLDAYCRGLQEGSSS
jgi:AcrR family transcriptional regulator